MFGDGPAPIEQTQNIDKDLENDEVIAPEDLPDPESIPSSLVPKEDSDDVKGGGRGKIIAGGGLVLLLALLAGLFVGREQVVTMAPATAGIYSMLGLSAEILGAGLNIRDVKSDRTMKDNVDILTIRGTVVNISDQPRTVPTIRVSLFNAENEEVQSALAKASKSQLPPGDRVRFKTQLDNPSALARRLEVTFTKEDVGELAPAAEPGGGSQAPAGKEGEGEQAPPAAEPAPPAKH